MPEEVQKQYELVCIVPPQLEGGDLENVKKEMEAVIQKNQGKIDFKQEKKHDLAYPINKQGQGIYIISQISISPEKISDFLKELKLNKQILRHLISQLPVIKPKEKSTASAKRKQRVGPPILTQPSEPEAKDIGMKPKPKTTVAKKEKPKEEKKAKLEEIDKKLDEIIKEI